MTLSRRGTAHKEARKDFAVDYIKAISKKKMTGAIPITFERYYNVGFSTEIRGHRFC